MGVHAHHRVYSSYFEAEKARTDRISGSGVINAGELNAEDLLKKHDSSTDLAIESTITGGAKIDRILNRKGRSKRR